MNSNSREASRGTIYFDSFGVEYISKEIKNFIGHKIIIKNIYIIKSYDSGRCGHFSIRFIGFMLKGKILLDYTDSFSPNDYEKNDKKY